MRDIEGVAFAKMANARRYTDPNVLDAVIWLRLGILFIRLLNDVFAYVIASPNTRHYVDKGRPMPKTLPHIFSLPIKTY